jgi:hypothetical protein
MKAKMESISTTYISLLVMKVSKDKFLTSIFTLMMEKVPNFCQISILKAFSERISLLIDKSSTS